MYKKVKPYLPLLLAIIVNSCNNSNNRTGEPLIINAESRRFFSASSFWNTPILENPEIDHRSEHFISLLKTEPTGNNFGINCSKWTVPVYVVDSTTPRYDIGYYYLSDEEKEHWATGRERFGHGEGFGKNVPIPDGAGPPIQG